MIQHLGGLDELSRASLEELQQVHDIGEKTARRIKEFFDDADNLKMLAELKEAGLTMEEEQKIIEEGSAIAGKSFVLTGKLIKFTRDAASKLIAERGGIVKGSVSKNTDYVIAGDKAGSKLSRAFELGIKILSEEEFEQLLAEG